MDTTDAVVPTPLDREETLARLGTHPAQPDSFSSEKDQLALETPRNLASSPQKPAFLP